MNELILTVGLPRSGKSTWAREQGLPIVNPDSIRLALHGQRFVASAEGFVWAIAETMIRSLFLAGHKQVILDATNVTRKRRDRWLSMEWETFYHELPPNIEVCIHRAKAENDTTILPVIERMAREYEPLTDVESQRVY